MHNLAATAFITTQLQLFRGGYQVNPDVTLLGYREFDDTCYEIERSFQDVDSEAPYDSFDFFSEVEEVGTKVDYRCVSCKSVFYAHSSCSKKLRKLEVGSIIDV